MGGKVKADYDHMEESRLRHHQPTESRGKQSKKDDPYYCGLRARIPNFAKSKAQRDRETSRMPTQPTQQQPPMNPNVHHPMAGWGHPGARGKSNGYSCQDFGQVIKYESDYSHIYGRLPVPTRGFRQYPPPRGQIYVSEWE